MLLIPFVYRDTHGLHAGICVIESHEVEKKITFFVCCILKSGMSPPMISFKERKYFFHFHRLNLRQ